MRVALFLSALLSIAVSAGLAQSKGLVIHEWGTFTSLQDETGKAIGGVNVDNEPLPKFVHRLEASPFSKSIGQGHPEVTMRLETPVIYFYPPAGEQVKLDITATFNSGFLTEYYPDAELRIGGKEAKSLPESIKPQTRGSLTWKDVTLGGVDVLMPATDEHVWTAPRKVNSSPVMVGREAEQYIFYRGVGKFDAPLRVMRSGDGKWLSIYDNREMDKPLKAMKLGGMWLADFRADGACAFRAIADAPAPAGAKAKAHSADFVDADYATANIGKLRAEMKQALVADGLFDDEAEAMLETWKRSYFQDVGQRLFFLVPRDWTDGMLPLEISQPCELTRVMMGRIELVTPEQREIIKQFTSKEAKPNEEAAKAMRAKLGRFADAMVNDVYRKETKESAMSPLFQELAK